MTSYVSKCPMATGHKVDGTEVTLPIYYIDCEVEIQIVLGFVYQRISFLNTTGSTISGVFTCPTNRGKATVCSCDLSFAGKTFSTSVVGQSEATKCEQNEELMKVSEAGPTTKGFDPNCFSMPFSGVPDKAEIIVEIRYVQELSFDVNSGEYSLTVPMTLPHGQQQIFENRSLKEAINYRILLAPGTDEGKWNSPSHVLDVIDVSPGPNNVGKVLTLEGNGENENKDLKIAYTAWSNQITGSVIYEPNSNRSGRGKEGGSFMAFLQPPSLENAKPLPRKMIFLLDQSYSMDGQGVLSTAKNALMCALDDLKPEDQFMICGYDQDTHFYKEGSHLIQATPQAIKEAKNHVRYIQTSGLTDILKPIKESTKLLDEGSHHVVHHHGGSGGGFGKHAPIVHGHIAVAMEETSADSQGDMDGLPFIVLITDGAVYQSQEKEILNFVNQTNLGRQNPIRVSTFGIGPYCNRYFLSMLSEAGLGYSETCLDMDHVESSMISFLSKTKSPVLSDIALNINLPGMKTYPNKIPDLTVGAPLVIAGTYDKGSFPQVFEVTGKTASGPMNFELSASMAENAPIVIMVETRRIQCLIGRWYMEPSDQKRKEIVDSSVAIGVPCTLTTTVAYENKDKVTVRQHSKHPVPPGIDGGHTSSDKSRPSVSSNQHSRKNTGKVAAVAGVVVLGTGIGAALAFGNVGATAANAPVGDAMASFFADGSTGMMAMAGSAWDAISGIDYGGVAGNIGNFAGDAAGAIGDGFSAIPGAVGGAAEAVPGFCTDCLGQCGPIGEFAGGALDGIGGCIGGLFEGVCGGGICECAGGLLGGVCEGGICDCAGGLLGGVGDCAGGLLGGVCEGGICDCAGGLLGGVGDCAGGLLGGVGECAGGIGSALQCLPELISGLGECIVGILE